MNKSVLIVAGTDPFLGAGAVADVRVLGHFGLDAIVVETALVDQDTLGVHGFIASDAEIFGRRLERVFANEGFLGIKVGMTASPDIVARLAWCLAKRESAEKIPVVLDPVLAGGSDKGLALSTGDMATALRGLLPWVRLVTPNASELASLSGLAIAKTSEEAEEAARELIRMGASACLLKGGHLRPLGSDWLVEGDGPPVLVHQGTPWSVDIHGTGCHLSSAILAFLVQGHSLREACTMASSWLHGLVAKNALIYRGPGRAQFDSFRFGDG